VAVVSSELFLYGVTLHHTVSGISSRVIDFLRMRARGLRGRRGTVCGVGEYPRHIHEVAWDFGSVFCLASVHADVYCHTQRVSSRFDEHSSTCTSLIYGIISDCHSEKCRVVYQ
jgi:hypothetical protein